MNNNKYKCEKEFLPLDNLFTLLEQMETSLNTSLKSEDYVVGKEQLFYTFFHETMHAFISSKASWIHQLSDDEVDFVDEIVARMAMDSLIEDLDLMDKMKLFFDNHVDHERELQEYGYAMPRDEYREIKKVWKAEYYKGYKIEEFCKYMLSYYKEHSHLHRSSNFEYGKNRAL